MFFFTLALGVAHQFGQGLVAWLPLVILTPFILADGAFGIAIIVIILSVVPPVPKSIEWREGCFMLAFGATMSGWFFRFARGTVSWPRSPLLSGLLLFWLLGPLTIITATTYGVVPSVWVRGILPFLTFLILFPAFSDLRREGDQRLMLGGLFLSATIFTATILVRIPEVWVKHSEVQHWISLRATLPPNAYQPVLLAACSYCIGQFALPLYQIRWYALIPLIVFISALSLTFLRSMILIIALLGLGVLVIQFIRNIHKLRPMIRVASRLGLLLCTIFALSWAIPVVSNFYTLILKTFLLRFSGKEYGFLESGRYLEWVAIIETMSESPLRLLFGNGLGYKFEFYHIYLGQTLHYGYTHCLLSYLLLTTGLLGVSIFTVTALTTVSSISAALQVIPDNRRPVLYGTISALLSIFMYVLMQSTFRHFSFNILAAVLFAIIGNMAISVDNHVNIEEVHG